MVAWLIYEVQYNRDIDFYIEEEKAYFSQTYSD